MAVKDPDSLRNSTTIFVPLVVIHFSFTISKHVPDIAADMNCAVQIHVAILTNGEKKFVQRVLSSYGSGRGRRSHTD